MAVIKGRGLEVAVTLGTAFGIAIFQDGKLAVHLELAHHPCHNGKTYSEYVGEAARRKIGGVGAGSGPPLLRPSLRGWGQLSPRDGSPGGSRDSGEQLRGPSGRDQAL